MVRRKLEEHVPIVLSKFQWLRGLSSSNTNNMSRRNLLLLSLAVGYIQALMVDSPGQGEITVDSSSGPGLPHPLMDRYEVDDEQSMWELMHLSNAPSMCPL